MQVNTVVMRRTVDYLPAMAALLLREGIGIWEVFFLIATGRALREDALWPQENADVCRFLIEASRHGLLVRTVEAPFIRRVLPEHEQQPAGGALYDTLTERLRALAGAPADDARVHIGRTGTLDGDGIVFIGHDGAIMPGGFLPLRLGNVRTEPLPIVYRSHPLLRAIRARDLQGACARCSFKQACGGSRARAYSLLADPLADDPACPWAAAAD